MKGKIYSIFVLGIICETMPYVFVAWPLLFFFMVPIFYLLFQDSHKRVLKRRHYCALAVTGSAIVMLPVVFYNIPTYITGIVVSTFLFCLFYLFARSLLRFFANRPIAMFIPPFLWVGICLLFNFRSFSAAVLDVGVQMPAVVPLIWWVGSIGITFLIVLFNSAVAYFLFRKSKPALALAVGILLVFTACFVYTRVKTPADFENGKEPFKVAVLQGNFTESWYWLQKNPYMVLERYDILTLTAAKKNPDLIVWPEYALPIDFINYTPTIRKTVKEVVADSSTPVLMGSILFNEDTGFHEDCALLLDKEGVMTDYYSSVQPAPFNQFAMGSTRPLKPLKGNLGVFVCWEELNSSVARNLANNGAQYFVTLSNDQNLDFTWFHRYAALFSRARAAENMRYLARSANTGITQIIDPFGRVIAKLPPEKSAFLVGDMYPVTNKTFYTRHGNMITITILIIIACLCGITAIARRKRK